MPPETRFENLSGSRCAKFWNLFPANVWRRIARNANASKDQLWNLQSFEPFLWSAHTLYISWNEKVCDDCEVVQGTQSTIALGYQTLRSRDTSISGRVVGSFAFRGLTYAFVAHAVPPGGLESSTQQSSPKKVTIKVNQGTKAKHHHNSHKIFTGDVSTGKARHTLVWQRRTTQDDHVPNRWRQLNFKFCTILFAQNFDLLVICPQRQICFKPSAPCGASKVFRWCFPISIRQTKSSKYHFSLGMAGARFYFFFQLAFFTCGYPGPI